MPQKMTTFLLSAFVIGCVSVAHGARLPLYNRLTDSMPAEYSPSYDAYSPGVDPQTQELLSQIYNFKSQLGRTFLGAQPSARLAAVPSADVGDFFDDEAATNDIYVPSESIPRNYDSDDYDDATTDDFMNYLADDNYRNSNDDLLDLQPFYPSIYYKKRSDSPNRSSWRREKDSDGGFERLYEAVKEEGFGRRKQQKGGKSKSQQKVSTMTSRKPKVVTTTTTAAPKLSPQRRGQTEVPILRPPTNNNIMMESMEEKDNLEKELPARRTRSSQSSHQQSKVVSTEAELTKELKDLKQRRST